MPKPLEKFFYIFRVEKPQIGMGFASWHDSCTGPGVKNLTPPAKSLTPRQSPDGTSKLQHPAETLTAYLQIFGGTNPTRELYRQRAYVRPGEACMGIGISDLRALVRALMESQGWEVHDRPDPAIEFDAECNSYAPASNTIRLNFKREDLNKSANLNTLAHEFCHSWQTLDFTVYVRPTVDFQAYLRQPVEVQANKVGRWVELYYTTGHPRWQTAKLEKPSRGPKKRVNALAKKVFPRGAQ